ncbi:phosphatidate phosphatase PAH2-like isoform X1 [Cynara cardunculus var. scolymus]|uniref:phosphatidate phosphatase PAH2-like isoform X1 n=1 Tax=Cynara cardunculus var. scolymus TaxID=59895 RepID=UPI000D625CC6|nr:phosphatidate phosphatase PAH2-like isoform X1 [Cynara cardunculus var. scolymus]
MYAVGRLGSYITQGVYTVSGPFHPFGGAVDIVVVQQPDGSLKSSPWYIKFGKFQGVLKAKERVVDINVNGVDADFHMYLDPRGEAYFLREVDPEEVVDAVSSQSSSYEEIDGKPHDKIPPKSKSMNYDFDRCDSVSDVTNGKVLSRTNSKRSRILGFVLGRRSMQEHSLSKEENDSNVDRIASLEHAEIAADLLEMKWSTNLSSRNIANDCKESIKDNGESIGGRLDASFVLHEQHFVNKSGGDNEMPVMEVHETCVADVVNKEVDEEHSSCVENCVSKEESSRTQLDDHNEAEVGIITAEEPLKIAEKICTEVAATEQGEASIEVVSCSSIAVPVCLNKDDKPTMQLEEANEIRLPLESDGEFQDVSGDSLLIKQVPESFVEEQLIYGDLDDSKPSINSTEQGTQSVSTSQVDEICSESMSLKRGPYPPPLPVRIRQECFKGDIEGHKGYIRRSPSHVDIPRNCEVAEMGVGRQAKSLPNMWSPFDDPNSLNEDSQFYSPAAKFRSSNWDLIREDIKKSNSEKELRLSDSQIADTLSKDLKDGGIASDGPSGIVDGAGGSWNLWPFRRLGSKNTSQKEQNSKKDSDVETVVETDGEKEASSPKSNKMHTRALAPTPEQLASLNLAEGKNTVTFTFSTSVLGAQKVDARIYLWGWDTRIVISDVDGTITKSDVLGQFMPLVGRDWSHIGVTHLFSAIKENGYQMLYLSARAISQASITRQFLFNLKQDGEALPDGPVVISPDGLFPSLFREVIRRAPHEFKIACLEDIKACFPSDRNPFYAGFGNRDTDEFSYLKVGISKGKIFIINPKGEVVVNRCIDSKSYASLHAIVNGIFPPISVHEEQEDYNSWNFWKLPPPTIE